METVMNGMDFEKWQSHGVALCAQYEKREQELQSELTKVREILWKLRSPNHHGEPGITNTILQCIEYAPADGVVFSDIMNALARAFPHRNIKPTDISPTLGRLVARGVIAHTGKRKRYRYRLAKKETTNG
jgi:hypothetical protein